jgi:hypothetical protein
MTASDWPQPCEVCRALVTPDNMQAHRDWHHTMSNLPPTKVTDHPFQRFLTPACHQCGGSRERHATEYVGSNGPFSEPDIVPVEEPVREITSLNLMEISVDPEPNPYSAGHVVSIDGKPHTPPDMIQ